MNKVVCNICGTSYPENAPQCPICGYVQNSEKAATANSENGTYTYVKGGRFSKANVKKRNQDKGTASYAQTNKKRNYPKKEKSSAGPIIVVAVLLLIIIVMVAYIVLRYFVPNDFLYEGIALPSGPAVSQESLPEDPSSLPSEQTEDTTASLECSAVRISADNIQLDGIGKTFQLMITLEPADTQDPVSYSTSDKTVATVSQDGLITAAGEGTAVITVTCGSVSAQCNVACTDPDAHSETLTLNRKEITFNSEGQSWLLYDGTIPMEDITWSSDDNKVATIENGKAVAVGNGDTTVRGVYNGQTVTCLIHCKFDEETQEGNSNISEAGGDSSKTYALYNPYGFAEDVTINPGDKFTLKLVDENKNEVTDAQWSVKDENVCTISNNTVEGKNSGTTSVTATYGGKEYTCVVRVN